MPTENNKNVPRKQEIFPQKLRKMSPGKTKQKENQGNAHRKQKLPTKKKKPTERKKMPTDDKKTKYSQKRPQKKRKQEEKKKPR